MSGGLDSTAIACMAAQQLAKDGQRLGVFGAVPMEGYRHYMSDGVLADETAYIEAVKEHASNIDVTYYRADGRHSLSDTERLLSILEQPYKIFENLQPDPIDINGLLRFQLGDRAKRFTMVSRHPFKARFEQRYGTEAQLLDRLRVEIGT